jgi:hypothetical protein
MSFGEDRMNFTFINLCSSAHTTTSLQWGRIAVCRAQDVHISVSRRYRYHPWTEKGEFQALRGFHLYRLCNKECISCNSYARLLLRKTGNSWLQINMGAYYGFINSEEKKT